MDDLDPKLRQAIQAEHDEHYDEALACLLEASRRILAGDTAARSDEFMAMFQWQLLTEAHPPAHDALAQLRDEQAARLLAGDVAFAGGRHSPRSRFAILVDMNELLGDAQATRDLFVRLEALDPGEARRAAHMALPALVEAGDFERAERYLPRDPRERIEELNTLALRLPLFAPTRAAPRLAIEVLNFVREVRLCALTWEGLGRGAEASRLRADALAGLASAEVRALAQRELDEPGAIIRTITAHQMALDGVDIEADSAANSGPDTDAAPA